MIGRAQGMQPRGTQTFEQTVGAYLKIKRETAAALVAGLVVVLVLAIYAHTTESMMAVWATSGTYAHGFIVLPAVLWMIWQRRMALAQTPCTPFTPGLLAVAGAGVAWMIGDLSASISLANLALVALIASAVLAIFGWAWARTLALPLAFLIFAVPFGDALIPVLVDWTADFTVAALKLSGVPVLREGNHFTISSGRWLVADACSGARYLMACLMSGTLFAAIMYRSPLRRAIFIGAAAILPIIANWMRAYMIVMLGHLSNNRIAVGIDHLIYGWIFFGVLIFVMFSVGARWREDDVGPSRSGAAGSAVTSASLARIGVMFAGVFALLALWPALVTLVATGDQRQVIGQPVAATNGWTQSFVQGDDWRPQAQNPSAVTAQSFASGNDRVTLHSAYFRDQGQGHELVSSENRLTTEGGAWSLLSSATAAPFGNDGVRVRSAVLLDQAGRHVLVWHWYWLGGQEWSSSDIHAKLDLAFDRLVRRSDTSAWTAVATDLDPEQPQRAAQVLQKFIGDMAAAIDAAQKTTAER
jgi:exosortase A